MKNFTRPMKENNVSDKLMCGRCYDMVDILYLPDCNENPEELAGGPLGMYHCPDCGAMIMAGYPHPRICKICLDKKHPGFDKF